MSSKRQLRLSALKQRASVFAALGDETRLSVLARLCDGEPQSIARLTAGTELTRQAVTKHLRVLEGVGVVRSVRSGRENLFALEPAPIEAARSYLDQVSRQWDNALARTQGARRRLETLLSRRRLAPSVGRGFCPSIGIPLAPTNCPPKSGGMEIAADVG